MSERRRRLPFVVTLAFAMIAVSLLSLLPASVFNAVESGGILEARGRERLLLRAQRTAAHLDAWFHETGAWAQLLDRRRGWSAMISGTLSDVDRRTWSHEVLTPFRMQRRLAGVAVLSLDGAIRAQSGAIELPGVRAGWAPFGRARGGGGSVWLVSADTPDRLFGYFVPVRGPSSEPLGLVAVFDDFAPLVDAVAADSGSAGPGSFGMLVDAQWNPLIDGSMRHREVAALRTLDRQWEASGAAALLRARLETLRTRPASPPFVEHPDPVDGQDMFTSIVPLWSVDWAYALTAPRAYHEAPVREQIVRVALLALMWLAVAAAVAVLTARRLSRPLRSLELVVAQWGQGGRQVRAELDGAREVAQLSETFNHMADEIAAHHAELEARVQARTAELEAVNRDLEMFTWSASHDLRAPLRAISGFAGLLREDYGANLPGEARAWIDRIEGNVLAMAALIDALLELGRVTREALNVEAVDLSQMAEDIIADHREADPERAVDVRIAAGLNAMGDARMLRIVLSNVLGNAWKFTSATDGARIAFERGKDGAFVIRDNGAGFDPTLAKMLFEPFRRLHDARRFPGTGIGLTTVRRVVERHGGTIRATGAIDGGAVFTFDLGSGGAPR